MRRSVKIRQQDISDCGATCLASVAAFHGLIFPVSRLRICSGTNTEGTTIAGIINAAGTIGLSANGYKGKMSSLYRIPKPAILHFKKSDGSLHFVVLYRINRMVAHIMDPAEGRIKRIKSDELGQLWTGHLIVLSPDSTFCKGRVGIPPWKRVWEVFRSKTPLYFKALFSSILFVLASISISFMIKYLIDTAIPAGDNVLVTRAAVAMLVLTLFSFVLYTNRSRILLKLNIITNNDLINSFVSKLFSLPHSYVESRRTGDITSRVDDAFKVGGMISEVMINLSMNLLTLLFSLITLFWIDWTISLFIIAFIPVYALLYYICDRFNKEIRNRIMENGAKFESTLIEGIKGTLTVKYFSIEQETSAKIREHLSELNKSLIKAGKWGIVLSGATDINSKLMSIVTLWAGSFFILSGTLSLGELILFYTMTALFSSPIAGLLGLNTTYREGMAAAGRLFEAMDLESEPYNEGITPDLTIDELKIENLTFGYPGRKRLFENFCMTLKAGKITALCGDSGCGKSTVASLLMRILKAEPGAISVDGIDINNINLRLWREWITIVPQNPSLLSGTIYRNIAPGEEDPDMDSILDLCRGLGLLDFIRKLPSGFDTILGEDGSRLSRGQQQRIAIARALYRHPRILLLDEVTSSCDRESAGLIKRVILKEKENGCMILLISHNREELELADEIVKIR